MGEYLATLNACLNATSGVLLTLGFRAIKRMDRARHARLMGSAFVVSCAFLVSYLTRYGLFGDTKFPGTGLWRPAYFTLLVSHVLLAIIVVPLVLRTLFLARKQRFAEHRRIARVTFPVWLYVSVTGVLVYLMLYRIPWTP